VPSFLSGLPPGALTNLTDGGTRLTDGATTLAEILNGAGYVTFGIVDNSFLAEGSGNEQGFDYYFEEMTSQAENRRLLFQKLIDRIRLRLPEITSPNTNPYMERDAVRRARDFVSLHSGERFFLWLHLYTPHQMYYPPKEYRDRVENELGITVPEIDVIRQEDMKNGWPAGTPERLNGLLAYYAGDVAFADDLVGEVIMSLKENDIYDSSLVVISSDHGEEFYEHERLEHSQSLYPEVIHVPLIFRYPGQIQSGIRINTPVSLIDLAPTILELARVDSASFDLPVKFFSESFVPLIDRDVYIPRPVFVERPLLFDQNIKAVIFNGLLYIGGSESILHAKLFDITNDPGAYYDIIRDRPDEATFMAGLITEFEETCAETSERIGATGMDEDIEKLRTLGYVN
jgi:arylsulfatase A-like enzyme